MARNGNRVTIIAGEGTSREKNVRVKRIPSMLPAHPSVKKVQGELARGLVTDRFEKIKKGLCRRIEEALRGADVCFIHNVFTMHFNLALTAALSEIVARHKHKIKFYAWCHDATLFNPDYTLFSKTEYPWRLITSIRDGVDYIAISKMRRRQFSKLFKVGQSLIKEVPDGLDIKAFLGIRDHIWRFTLRHKLLSQDLVLFYPSRILRRKNYELAVKTVRKLADSGLKVKLLMTGAPDPHNPQTGAYLKELRGLIKKLALSRHVVLLYDLKKRYGKNFEIGYVELKNLYDLSDMLFITSRQEGFGIPLLEAAARKVPIACSALPPFKEISSGQALIFSLTDPPERIAERISRFLYERRAQRMFRKVLREYSWIAIYNRYLKALIG
jgi:glycosyltransferase involved in cell wall biosynthesis